MMQPEFFADLLLAISIAGISILFLVVKNIFTSINLFICMGLLVTLAWSKLGAHDVAIAEAAIGSGLTGALLLATWKRIQNVKDKER